MIGNYFILLFSSLFIFLLIFYLYLRAQEIDILDIYIIFVLFHFGFYPFVRGLHFGKDIIFDFTYGDPLAIGLVFTQVLIILIILKLLSLIFIKNSNYLKIGYLVENYSNVNNYVLLSICGLLVLFQIFSYYKYGVKSYIPPKDFERIGKFLPYWFTSVRTIYNCVSFFVCLVLISKFIKTRDRRQQILWLFLTIFFILFGSMYGGKKYFINVIVLFVIAFFDYKEKKIIQWRNLKYGFVLLVAFFLFSNFFESYRDILMVAGKVSPEEAKELSNPLSKAINCQPTLTFLERRPGTWEFSYLVLSKQIMDGIPTTNGKILQEGIKSAIPRYLWAEKKFSLIDDTLANIYGVRAKEIDIGKNNYGVAQVEFGFISIIIVPVTILLLLILMELLNKITSEHPIFLWLFSGNILIYLVNIEENGTDIFFMLRNIIILLLLFAIFISFEKIYSIIGIKKLFKKL